MCPPPGLQVHLADLELDLSDVKFDKKGRAVQSDYLIILRVFLVFAVPLFASMVSASGARCSVVGYPTRRFAKPRTGPNLLPNEFRWHVNIL